MIHPDDFLNDDNYSVLDEEIEVEINNSKDKDRIILLWRRKCELNRDIQNKQQQLKALANQRNQVNEKLTTTLQDCNSLNQTIDFVEKQKWKKVFEKNI